MLVILGYIIVIASVLGGYCASGGHIHALIQPYEFLIIVGAAVGSFVISNTPKVIKASIKASFATLKGSGYNKKFFIQLLSMFFELTNKIRKDGVLAIEADIENFKESPLFSNYPLVQKQAFIMEFICDHLRLIITGRVDVTHLEDLMDEDIETFENETELHILAIAKLADGMPAFGIVAAVMGVVITMSSLGTSSPEELGEHVATALVGTFMGVLIGYGFVAPISGILQTKLLADLVVLQSIKVVLVASVHNLAPTIAVEFARKVLYSGERPTSRELEEILKDVKSGKKEGDAAPASNETATS